MRGYSLSKIVVKANDTREYRNTNRRDLLRKLFNGP